MLEQSQGADRRLLRRDRSEGRRTIDLAQGILIGRYRYSPGAAFAELLAVSRRHDITLTAAADALIDLAIAGDTGSQPPSVEAAIAAFEWGGLFADTRADANHVE